MGLSQRLRRIGRVLTPSVNHLRQLVYMTRSYAQCHGGWRRSIIKGGVKCARVLAREGPRGLAERLPRYSRQFTSLPGPVHLRLQNRPTLQRIAELDIYGTTSNLERAGAVCAGRPALLATRRQMAGLSVMILTKNRPEYVIPLLEQLLREKAYFRERGFELEILLGDTGSDNADVLHFYKRINGDVRIVMGMQYQFSRCNNELATQAHGEVLLFLNNDIILPSERGTVFRAFERYRSSANNGAFGFAMYYQGGQKIQHMGMAFIEEPPLRGLPYHINHGVALPVASIPPEARYPAVTGACLMLSRKLFFDVNGFDPCYQKECQDVALCLELLRLGYQNKCLNIGKMIHYENGTRPGGEEDWKDRATFLRKYGSYIEMMLSERKASAAHDRGLAEFKGVAA